ncbi:hypothetical protein [Streptomyces lancefieldiae]|uniref:Uncharacterized protein n=1 Tax=Streptomyces lancefieldiae TaxID=3075520 RepID=A0ABU3AT70_9ACTN|nr:hypothetical protein [Streptomyces sp. DSM 40712]MDT0611986.1 hypothetical protein [Streptomyces sp. DSM 40712]
MTKAEKELAIERVGSMVWRGAMDMTAAVWFVAGLYKVDWPEAEDMIHDAMVNSMAEEIDKVTARMGDKRDH